MCEPCIMILQPGWQQESVSYVGQGSPNGLSGFQRQGASESREPRSYFKLSITLLKNAMKSFSASWLVCRVNLRGVGSLDLCPTATLYLLYLLTTGKPTRHADRVFKPLLRISCFLSARPVPLINMSSLL